MPHTRTQARDEMFGLVKTTVDNITAQDRPTVVYEDSGVAYPTDASARWLNVKLRHQDADQASLANDSGKRRWKASGVLIIEVYTPSGGGFRLSDSLSDTITGAFKGPNADNRVWYRRPRSIEMGRSGSWMRTDVFVDFEYDEFK